MSSNYLLIINCTRELINGIFKAIHILVGNHLIIKRYYHCKSLKAFKKISNFFFNFNPYNTNNKSRFCILKYQSASQTIFNYGNKYIYELLKYDVKIKHPLR